MRATDLFSSLCFRCDNCWGSTKDHKAKCTAYPSGRYSDGIPIHEIVLVDYRDECEFYEEKDDWNGKYLEWKMERIRARTGPWTSQSGEVRYYLDDWYDLISDVVEKYAEQEWTSPDIDRIKRCKVWFDKDAEIHVDGMKDDVVRELIASNVDRRFFALPLEEGSKGSRCFGLSDFSAEDLDEIMDQYPNTFKRLDD